MSNQVFNISGIGAVVADPKTIETVHGNQCLSFPLAAREFFMDKSGAAQFAVTYIDAEYWASGEMIKLANVKKGDLFEFKGRLSESSWEVKEKGEKRKKHLVKIKSFKRVED